MQVETVTEGTSEEASTTKYVLLFHSSRYCDIKPIFTGMRTV